MKSSLAATALALLTLAACTDAPSLAPNGAAPANLGAAADDTPGLPGEVTSSVRWNRTAIALFRARGGNAGRIHAYLSVAQYRAVLAAERAQAGTPRPSRAGAAAGASAVVLSQFYPLDVASIDAALAAQRAEPPSRYEPNTDFAAGEALGRSIAASVLAYAATDNFGLTSPGLPPVGPGYWVSNGGPIVRGGLGARPFFLRSGSELRLSPPPAFGSKDYLRNLAEVRAFASARTPQQVATTLKWVPFSAVVFNLIADSLIVQYGRKEVDAARILAYANAAAFDAIIGCFDTKYAYWYVRPTQADPSITLATGLPNHPSYPSAHSCETGAFEGVLVAAFPRERGYLAAVADEASMSRVIGGLHYRFDGDDGLALGRSAARLALTRRGLE